MNIDSTKARKRLDWKLVFSISDSIVETINWYKSFYKDEANMKDITINQINNYISKAREKNLAWTTKT